MIIENPDAFKSWLTSILEPLCDADPAALAKYVYALVKKDKSLDELRDGMLDQLDVFLQQETKPFVDMLFKSLESQEYLKPSAESREPREPSPQPEQTEPDKQPEQENHVSTAPTTVVEKPPMRRSPPHRVVVPRLRQHPQHEQTLVKVLPTELLEEPVDAPRRRDRRNDSARDKEDRRRRRSRSWERRARRRCARRSSRSPSPRGRYRNRSPPTLDRHGSRSRSRSPVPIRDRELERERDRMRPLREMDRDRMSRDREHRDRITRSRDRERSRERSISPHETRIEHADVFKRRCRDFDVKGYCMRGDLCEWDHGADPVVLEDAALTRVLAGPPALAEYNPAAPDIWSGGVVGAFPPPPPPHHLAPRELVPIPRVRHEPPMGAAMPPPPRHPPPPKKTFEYNRLGPPRPFQSNANCSLEVKKVPRGLNDITHLNNHFCKFGKIVNIQVCFEGDPEAALITFSNPTEANVAYKSTEAVLNNRFIKVFWHNPENKQENTAPPGQQAHKQTDRQNSHPMSHNKVLINKENMKATADNKTVEKNTKEQSNGNDAPAPRPNPRQLSEHHRRAQELLQSQLRQQRLMIEKLEAGGLSDQQRTALMDAIKASHDGIEKLREQLVAYNGMRAQMQEDTVARSMARLQLQANVKKPKTAQEAQKEILDAELDIITKQQEGQDVSELSQRIAALRRAAAALAPRRTNRGGRFNPAMRFSRASKVFSVNQSVDHRPRALLVSGFEPDELDALLAHFAQFGEITGKEVNLSVPELVVQYRARQHAEHALHAARNYSDRTLSITWVTNSKPIAAPALNGDSSHEIKDVTRPARLDEDEEDEEHRSWRR
ncbi:RNA-binding protein 26 isoform X1 [Danaus plexippus]|uniref:RNA-binding protein 26 isoform X1 n=1 Tax=Danaus plexippus TaxID=13037 RepID=UPI002AB23B28|nr:RNA-binding protein 26 isoform X1 [Danaus plexippus]